MSTESGQYNTGYARRNLIFTYEKLELFPGSYAQFQQAQEKKQKREIFENEKASHKF